MNYGVPNDATFAAVLVFALFAAVLAVVAERTHFFPRAVRWIQNDPVVRTALVALLFAIGPITARTKNGQLSLPRPPLLLQVEEPAPAPSIAPVTVHTNGVVFRAESTNAVEIAVFRIVGGAELGDWIETAAPFFAVGTNPVNRCFVSASGSVSFDSMRRPPVGSALPDGTGLPVLCPLRAPLGMVPEANWTNANTQSRFWHDALPGGGRVLTWENALVDRLPGRRVTLQVELQPTGDSVFRYDFHDELDPPPTNFVMGAQMGTNGVNVLSILGTNILAATVWNVDGASVTNGVSIADLLCTNGVLRTPAAFEIRWKNTTGLDPEADTDDDGLTDWAETFVWGTDPNHTDTDGDGTADNVELMMGADPFDADEDNDGIPDGVSAADWAANTLWAANSADGGNVTIVLNEAIPAGASATLVLGDLAIPLRGTNTMEFCLPFGETIEGRLFSRGVDVVKLSLSPRGQSAVQELLRGGASNSTPRLRDDPRGVLDGNSNEGTFRIAIPEVVICNPDGTRAVSECIHTSNGSREYIVRFVPDDWGLSLDNCIVEGFERIGNNSFRLSVGDDSYDQIMGRVWLTKYVDYGFVEDSLLLWRCSMPADEPYPVVLAVNVGVSTTNVFKGILPRHSTNPPGRPTMPCRLRVTGWTEHDPTFHISGPKLKFGPDARDSLTATLSRTNIYDFVVSGEVASESMNDAVITVRRDGPSGPVCTTAALTIVWVDPITIRSGTNETFSADNNSLVKPRTSRLGLRSVSFTGDFATTIGHVVEIKGDVHPMNLTVDLEFKRDVVDQSVSIVPLGGDVSYLTNSLQIARTSPEAVDPMWPKLQDRFPFPFGHIYDIDVPGVLYHNFAAQQFGTRIFARYNFIQYACLDGIRCSDDFPWHANLAIQKGSETNTNALLTAARRGHPEDNSVGPGHTPSPDPWPQL